MRLRGMLLPLLFCGSELIAAPPACDLLYVKGNELWFAGDGAPRRVLQDPLGVNLPRFSPRGTVVAYVRELSDDPNKLPSLVIADVRSGSTVKTIPLSGLDVSSVVNLGWISSEKLWIDGHNNPSAGVYYEVNINSGKLSSGSSGSRFSPSPNGKHVIQDEFVPHAAPAPHDSSVALLDNDRIYPPEADRSYHRFEQRYSWSPDSSRVAFVDSRPDLRLRSVVVVSAQEGDDDRKISSFPLPSSVVPERMAWTDQGTIAIASGDHYYLYDPKASTLAAVPQQPPALQATVVKDADGTFPVEDRYCHLSVDD